MEIERPHRTTTTTTSDLFICFTSRLSHSSSMRLSTRSILSPGRAASGGSAVVGGGDRSTSAVATTLSRRLRRNGSLRGGAQSPALFPATATTTKKSRGSSAFAENPEPSSPKVTCIGQVRVKTKKQGKKMKLRACGSKRIGGEASFRRIQQPPPPPPPPTDSPARNPRWVHLPSSICETLKGFGSEFSCLLPCKSSCFSSNNNNNNNNVNNNNNINNDNNRCLNSGNNGGSTTCGGVFRWWVSVEEGGGEGRRRDIELVVGGNDEEDDDGVDRDRVRVMERECSRRRSIFDDVEFDDLFNGVANNVGSSEDKVEEDVVGRISICVPPKNALLLMRCKSDPMRMASLSKKFLEASSFVECHSDGEDGFVEGKVRNHVDFGEVVGVKEEESEEIRDDLVEKMEEIEEVRAVEEVAEHRGEVIGDVEEKPCVENREETEEGQGVLVEENRNETEGGQSFENVDEDEQVTEMMEGENGVVDVVDEEVVDESEIWQVFIEMPRYEAMEVEEEATGEEGPEELSSDSLTCCLPLEESKEVDINEESVVEVVKEVVVVEDEEGRKSMEKEVSKSILPDCLLLMMCEPKLSMEVSKETWVRRSDFVRCLPERHLKQKPKQIDDVKDQPIVSTKKPKPAAVAAQPPLPPTAQTGIRPGRSSISFPTGGSTVAKKLAKVGVGVGVGVGYEPFVLPRCKSAPMRSAAKFGQPELACSMWGRENERKLEPHRPATCGVGAAGVGF